jgi:excisionase family DNA binding protein
MNPHVQSNIITTTVAEFCRLSGLGRTKVYQLVGDGSLDSFNVGKRRLIVLDSYRRLIERRVAASAAPALSPNSARRSLRRRMSE